MEDIVLRRCMDNKCIYLSECLHKSNILCKEYTAVECTEHERKSSWYAAENTWAEWQLKWSSERREQVGLACGGSIGTVENHTLTAFLFRSVLSTSI